MNLDEAIKHCEEVVKSERQFENQNGFTEFVERHYECAREHEQLAEWLTQLLAIKNIMDTYAVDSDEHILLENIQAILGEYENEDNPE